MFFRSFLYSCVLMTLMAALSVTARAGTDAVQAGEFRRQGLAAQAAGDYGNALILYSRAAVFAPADPVLQNDLGLVYQASRQYREARECYQKAIDLDPEFLPAHYNIGSLYQEQGQFEMAAFHLNRRVQMGDPRDPWTLKAQEEMENIFARFPDMNRDRIRDSAAEMEFVVARDRMYAGDFMKRQALDDFVVAFEHGRAAMQNRNYSWAVRHFEEAARLNPESFEARHALQRARMQLDREAASVRLAETLGDHRREILDQYIDEAQSMVSEGGY